MASSAVSQSHNGQLHHPPAGAGSMMARVDRLDLVVGYLEEMRHSGGGSARSSTSPSTATTFSSSSPTTPRCRPAEELLRETRAKGSLVERIAFLENRVLRMEEERMEPGETTPERTTSRLSSSMSAAGGSGGSESGRKKKGLKSLVKSCVRGGAKLKTKE
ncbi:unnamed protein product [Alopecurus aequalis]